MNRIQPPPLNLQPPINPSPSAAPRAEVALVRTGRNSGSRFPFALFAPLHYESNYAYPLVVWLHGPGESEAQLKRIMPLVSLRNYVAIAPRGTAAAAQATAAQNAAAESNAAEKDAAAKTVAAPPGFDWQQTEEHIHAADERVLECIEIAAEKFHISPDRCFLAGHDSGGTMAFRIAMQNPRRFAGAISLGGPLPSGQTPLAQLHAVRRLSVFIGCARASLRYPSAAVCDDLRLLHIAGMSIVLREYPGGDGMTPTMLGDVDRWIMDQIAALGAPAIPAEKRVDSWQ